MTGRIGVWTRVRSWIGWLLCRLFPCVFEGEWMLRCERCGRDVAADEMAVAAHERFFHGGRA